jgi:hypothetical protein
MKELFIELLINVFGGEIHMMFLALFIGALILIAIGIIIGYFVGKKDGREEEAQKWKPKNEYVEKKGVKIE